ncbi:hypothetical protein GW835_01210 [archaeon]|nr:hypothetical protein [archaeon]NCP79170.1 hypothetical protein [archaeon]NCP97883.1 hypothetical protein [archaeon]NCQ06937.1 hypothetical protein [archaeon]NCQ50733.1 hypothetical protein [archaeon]
MPTTEIHIVSNILLIAIIYLFDKEVKKWFLEDKKSFLYLCLSVFGSNLIDIDHLLATPIYDPTRCSINFHPLHSWYTMPLWVLGLLQNNKFIRYFSLGVLLHLWLDWISCLLLI